LSGVLERDRVALAGLIDDRGLRPLRILEVVDGGRRRRDPDRQYRLTEERVHEGRLAVVELADDDEVEAILFELPHELAIEALLEALGAEPAGDLAELLERHRHVELSFTESFEHGLSFGLPTDVTRVRSRVTRHFL